MTDVITVPVSLDSGMTYQGRRVLVTKSWRQGISLCELESGELYCVELKSTDLWGTRIKFVAKLIAVTEPARQDLVLEFENGVVMKTTMRSQDVTIFRTKLA